MLEVGLFVVGVVVGIVAMFFYAKNNKEDIQVADQYLDSIKKQVSPSVKELVDEVKNRVNKLK